MVLDPVINDKIILFRVDSAPRTLSARARARADERMDKLKKKKKKEKEKEKKSQMKRAN